MVAKSWSNIYILWVTKYEKLIFIVACGLILISDSKAYAMNKDNSFDLNKIKINDSVKFTAGLGELYYSNKYFRWANNSLGFGQATKDTPSFFIGSAIDLMFKLPHVALSGVGILTGGYLTGRSSYDIYRALNKDLNVAPNSTEIKND